MNVFHRLCFKVKSAIDWREDFVLGKETSLSIRRSRFFYPFLCLSCNFENVAVQSSIILIIMGTLVPSPCCNLLSLYRNTLNYIIPSLPLLFFASSHLDRFSLNHSSVITHSSVVSPWLVSVAPIPEINYILICIQRWSFAAKHGVGRKKLISLSHPHFRTFICRRRLFESASPTQFYSPTGCSNTSV